MRRETSVSVPLNIYKVVFPKYESLVVACFKEADGTFVGALIIQQRALIQKHGDAGFRLFAQLPNEIRRLTHAAHLRKCLNMVPNVAVDPHIPVDNTLELR